MPDIFRAVCLRTTNIPTFGLLFAVGCGLLLTLIVRAPAQQTNASGSRRPVDSDITCTLQDALGHPVSGIAVEVRSNAAPPMSATAPTSPDGSVSFHGLAAGTYDVTVAGGFLIPPKRVQISRPNQSVVLQLPITLPQVAGHRNETVSVDQLAVPEKAREAVYRAYAAWGRGDARQSRDMATRALQIHPYYGPALTLLGILELSEGHAADAIVELQQAVHYNPNSPRTYLALASAYNELHKNAEALDALSIAAKLVPDSWQLHYEIGRAYVGQGCYEAALDEFDRAQQSTEEERMVLHVGKAHALLGLKNYPAARAEFEIVIRKSPDGPYAAESRELTKVLDSQPKKRDQNTTATANGSAPGRFEQ